MKLANIINKNFIEALERLRSQKVPMKGAFALSGVSKKVREEVTKFEEVRKAALERLCDRDEDGNPLMSGDNFNLSQESMRQLAQELSELTSMEIDVGQVKLKDLGDTSALTMSTYDAEILEGVIDLT